MLINPLQPLKRLIQLYRKHRQHHKTDKYDTQKANPTKTAPSESDHKANTNKQVDLNS